MKYLLHVNKKKQKIRTIRTEEKRHMFPALHPIDELLDSLNLAGQKKPVL